MFSFAQANKPLMERRRRERINNCLDQLKTMLMDTTKKEVELCAILLLQISLGFKETI